jgi:hypothetical protein
MPQIERQLHSISTAGLEHRSRPERVEPVDDQTARFRTRRSQTGRKPPRSGGPQLPLLAYDVRASSR